MKIRKMFFISLQKLLSFSRKSKFRTLDFMPKPGKRNTFNGITWEVNSLFMKFHQFISYNQIFFFCPNQLADLVRFLFTEDSLKIKKSLEFFDKKFVFCNITPTSHISLPETVLTSKIIQ